jgi:hypothetical protein
MFSNLWASSNEGTQPSKTETDEVSLTSILPTPSLRTDLALLVALSSDAMRRDLLAPFDVSKPNGLSDSSRSPIPPAEEENLIDFEGSEETNEAAMAAAEIADRQRREYQRELSSPQMQGLRRAALTFFDGWQVGVLRRVGEVLGVRSDAVRQARRQHAASTAALAKEKRTKQYLDWANGGDEGKNEEEASTQGSPSIPTRLAELDEPKRILILHCLLLLLLSLENYTAHSRVLLLHITQSLLLPRSILTEHETSVAQGLLAAASNMSADETTARAAASDATNRKWKVGLATVAGAALIGVTGGLAAPILAAGVGTVMGGLGLGATALSGLLGSLAGSSVLIGGLFGAYGGRMTGRVMEKYAKEVEDFKFIPLNPSDEDTTSTHKLRVAIAITGWLTTDSEITTPWRVLSPNSIEPFALRWELSALLRLGASLSSVLKSFAWSAAKLEIVRRTLLGSLYAGLWPLGLVKMATLIDNPFLVAKSRADKAGKVLADALMDRCQGKRPVTLIGYSLGARVIYACLLSLAERNAFGIVEDVVFMGAPVSGEAKDWARIRAVVAGRAVNVYSSEDYILGFLYRGSSVRFGVAGLGPVTGVEGVENVDVSKLVAGHLRYRFAVGQILEKVGFEDIDEKEVVRERDLMVKMEREEGEKEMSRKERNEGEGKNEGEVSTVTVDRDASLAKETEKLQLESKVPVEEVQVHDEPDSDDESEDGKIQMVDLDPTPEPEPENEPDESKDEAQRVRFGSPDRGFDIVWARP